MVCVRERAANGSQTAKTMGSPTKLMQSSRERPRQKGQRWNTMTWKRHQAGDKIDLRPVRKHRRNDIDA
ncbi:hypothetical protein CCGE525_34410 (plasmid) [Rhizobium jaguaris]|uniref:Uncharacterized protein n=1 Tax=Rhizobium jaguaris TaxID=1312183 RepID=A0A387G6V6_9HYPH|nr:hypothetical protein CCGE525_34410 [Rhizobium jaguaris]